MAVDFTTIITSAAVGGVVASAIGFVGQVFERRSRRMELLLSKSIELAVERTRFVFEVAKAQKEPAEIGDPGIHFAKYFKWLQIVLEKGELPDDLRSGVKREKGQA